MELGLNGFACVWILRSAQNDSVNCLSFRTFLSIIMNKVRNEEEIQLANEEAVTR
jgi:hypothetical protein